MALGAAEWEASDARDTSEDSIMFLSVQGGQFVRDSGSHRHTFSLALLHRESPPHSLYIFWFVEAAQKEKFRLFDIIVLFV